MKRRLNPWIGGSALVLGAVGAWLGWLVTDLSCRADQVSASGGCPIWAVSIAGLSFIGVSIGTAVVLAMTSRSIAEFRQSQDISRQTPDASQTHEPGS